ncbi:MAG: hypothetical protein HRU26_05760 [Psychroserpens sp.]|nr:hypothetical protein [Psychroserpens sp.]
MKKGQKLQYIGKGFIGFHPHFTEMEFISNEGLNDCWVNYKGGTLQGKMLVRKSEVKIIQDV